MARKGRPTAYLKAKDYNGAFLSESDQLIIAVLRRGPRTFTKLQEVAKLSTSTLSDHLKKLEKIGYVGRSPEDSRIIQLTPKASNPKWKTLQNLATVCPIVHLDIDAGEKLLTHEVVDALFVISSIGPNFKKLPLVSGCPHPPTLACHKEYVEYVKGVFSKYQYPTQKFELNEYLFLKGFSRFNLDLRLIEELERGFSLHGSFVPGLARWGLYTYKEELVELLKRGTEDSEIFPARGVVKQTGTLKQFYDLLDWIRPLIEGPEFVEGRKLYRENRVGFYGGRDLGELPAFEMKSITWPTPSNLASIVFDQAESNYREKVLFPLWTSKLRSSITRRKGKGKGRG